ncbi:MAG: phosphatase PAP2 family protein [Muribaculum sp.]|nr:phosphatase PAP2 family protein [Muribaculaceae bacterium]MCM1080720.1 phosphatase PAP2 family protein [Muribaculum sp.]
MEICNRITAAICCMAVALTTTAKPLDTDSVATSERNVREIITSATGAVVLNAAITEALKAGIHEMRPNRNDNHSFPSRHTSWIFTASTLLSNELYRYSPWYSLGAQAVATAVGLQRVASKNHYGSDVVAGATIGIASTELSYFITGKIFGNRKFTPVSANNDFRASVEMATEAVYYMRKDMCTGVGSTIRLKLPMSENWGAAVALRGSAAPVKSLGQSVAPLGALAFTVGATGHFQLPTKSLAINTTVDIGAARLFHTTGWKHSGFGFEGDADAALSWRLTQAFAFNVNAGYRLITMSKATSAITLGVSSVAIF